MKLATFGSIVTTLAASATLVVAAESVAGVTLHPGASSANVEGSEKVLKATGYPIAVCRHTTDSLAKVVAFYRNDKQLTSMGEPMNGNAGFYNKAGDSMSINSPWMNPTTLQISSGTMICIAGKGGK